MTSDSDSRFDDVERAARDIADPATRKAFEALIAAVRAAPTDADIRSDDLH